MEFGEYLVGAEQYRRENKEQRRGQAYMNYLHQVRKDLYRSIAGTELNPFYDDNRMNSFMDFLIDNWKGDTVRVMLNHCPMAIANHPEKGLFSVQTDSGDQVTIQKNDFGDVKISLEWYDDMDSLNTLVYTLGFEQPMGIIKKRGE